jgi:pyruvate kinase
MSPLTEEDEANIIEFAISEGFEYLCLSNTRKMSDIEYVRQILVDANAPNV